MVLRMDSPAPAIKVQSWLRGEPLTAFQPGKLYIVEFWATWCGPCVSAMPHLAELQEKYKDRGLEVVGVAASEHAPTADEARTKLDAWLTENCSYLNYRIAFDFTGEMGKLWMEPSLSLRIPTSFVVDRDGAIAFIGHPTELDKVLPKVINGRWRTSKQAKAGDAKRIAEDEARMVKMPIFEKYYAAFKAQEWHTALSAIEEGVALFPDDPNIRTCHANLLLHEMRDMRAGMPVMQLFVRDAINQNCVNWLSDALEQLFDPEEDYSYLPSAERFAMGKELSEHILALDPPAGDGAFKFLYYPALGQYFYESGDKDRAIELIEVALKSLADWQNFSEKTKRRIGQRLLQALANYKGEQVCSQDLCVAPQQDFPKPNRTRRKTKDEEG
ncbi:TlpA disulfide reductase family protein [Mesorhizobium sp. WSM2561]|uniref:TlpA disulfide reductase family protein n=1 Tax=Mesorhizobium sp. WSM2561 TaxID=1040985 RepID=UPI000480B8D9|nr:TlpA disulfide reductase family protein [Mesorhizobium sp. WSM2561]